MTQSAIPRTNLAVGSRQWGPITAQSDIASIAIALDRTTNGGLNSKIPQLHIAGGPTGGTFKLNVYDQVTAALPFNATAAQVKAALDALGLANPVTIAATPLTVTCTGGPLPGTNVNVDVQNYLPRIAESALTGGTSPIASLVTTFFMLKHEFSRDGGATWRLLASGTTPGGTILEDNGAVKTVDILDEGIHPGELPAGTQIRTTTTVTGTSIFIVGMITVT